MKIKIKNVGIVKSGHIDMDGLTIITGSNNSGKSTVGKILYSIISAYHDLDLSFDYEAEKYSRELIYKFLFETIIRERGQVKNKNIMDFYNKYRFYVIREKSFDEFWVEFQNDYVTLKEKLKPNTEVINNFDRNYQRLFENIHKTRNRTSFTPKFLNDRLNRKIDFLFNNQFKNVACKNELAEIEFSISNDEIYNYYYDEKINIKDSPMNILDYRVFYISDASQVIDKFDETSNQISGASGQSLRIRRYGITPNDILNPDDDLIFTILNKASYSRIQLIQDSERVKEIIGSINELLPGKFRKEKGVSIYSVDNINIKNLASGAKTIALLKILIESNALNDKSILVFDEPEIHLHPEWINKLAEILVVMQKTYQFKIVLTTHSINLLLAIDYMRIKHDLDEKIVSVYESQKDKDGYVINFKKSDLESIFDNFSSPFLKINQDRNDLLEEEE